MPNSLKGCHKCQVGLPNIKLNVSLLLCVERKNGVSFLCSEFLILWVKLSVFIIFFVTFIVQDLHVR